MAKKDEDKALQLIQAGKSGMINFREVPGQNDGGISIADGNGEKSLKEILENVKNKGGIVTFHYKDEGKNINFQVFP